MCGIVGIAGNITPDMRKAFKDMLLVCQVRGRDSTGAFRVDYRGKTEIAKMIGTPEILLDMKSFDHKVDNYGSALVGHCRSKTFGDVSVANAHPFKHDHITGVHNGTLRGIYGMPMANQFGTDSEFLFWSAAQEGMPAIIREIEGAWALVWWDEKEETLNFLRNKERPLYFTYTKDMKTMIWASEIWMTGAFSRHFDLWDGGEDKRIFVPLPVDQLYSWKINSHGKDPKDVFTLTKIIEVKGKEVRGYQGNGVLGKAGTGNSHNPHGGLVKRPFDLNDVAEVTKRFMTRVGFNDPDEDLNDPLPDESEEILLLPPSPELINSQGELLTTSSKETPSKRGSRRGSDSAAGKTNSNSGRKPILSLVQSNLENSAQDSSANTSPPFGGCRNDSRYVKSQVSFRTVAGVQYISCKMSNREWTEETFEGLTACMCQWCKSPIGDLKEVHRIFVNKPPPTYEEQVSFVCESCFSDVGKVSNA